MNKRRKKCECALTKSIVRIQKVLLMLIKKLFYAKKKEISVHPGAVNNGKFVTLTPFQKNRPKSIKPPQTNAKKVCF